MQKVVSRTHTHQRPFEKTTEAKQKKRKKSRFLDFQKKRKKRKKTNSNNMHCRPKVLSLNTTLSQICCPLRNY